MKSEEYRSRVNPKMTWMDCVKEVTCTIGMNTEI